MPNTPDYWRESGFSFIGKPRYEGTQTIRSQRKAILRLGGTNEEIALGFVGDGGDLAKLVVAENGKRNIPDSKKKLEHELADCLWSVIVLAEIHNVNLESAFVETMDKFEVHLLETQ